MFSAGSMMDFGYDSYLSERRNLHCEVSLQNQDLWQKFNKVGTEMIVTKSGRRMFPALRIQIQSLDPNVQYCVFLELAPKSENRYKYSGGWSPAGSAEPHSPHRLYLHPDSPAPGNHWMSQTVNFNRLKLTNSAIPHPGHVVLSSMHKYQPRVLIVQAPDPRALPWAPSTVVSFPETQFIAVTAYQNDKITKLKIDYNPFAKGFRENGQSRCKRKREQPDEIEVHVSASKRTCTESDESFISSPESSPHPQTTEYSRTENSYLKPQCNINYQQTTSWFPYPAYSLYNYSMADSTGYDRPPVYLPDVSHPWTIPPPYPYQSTYTVPVPYTPLLKPQDLSTPKLRKLTDFSIRAITDM